MTTTATEAPHVGDIVESLVDVPDTLIQVGSAGRIIQVWPGTWATDGEARYEIEFTLEEVGAYVLPASQLRVTDCGHVATADASAQVTAERHDDGSIVLRVSTPAPGSTEERAFALGPAAVQAVVSLALESDEALERVLRVLPNIDAGNDVRRWPEDEADLHRNGDWLSFTERNQAVHDYRRGKVASAILAELTKGA